MLSLTSRVAALSVYAAVAVSASIPCARNYTALSQKLSETALIYSPGTDLFAAAVARWSNSSIPVSNLVVVPGTENDVVEIVKFANANSMPFLATNGVHGSITSLSKMTTGIEIYLGQLDNVTIATDGTTATIGGGIISRNLTDVLWAAGKQTVTGTCECVGYLGPALGGGHGWLQGHHGLVSDQFVSLNVVLANGSMIVVSGESNIDLFWAMRGAGHNFGIVTSVTSKIYDIVHPNYALQTMTFSGTDVEAVYATANELWLTGNGTQPAELHNWSYWFYDPTLDADAPVIQMYIIQEGVDVVDANHTAAFAAIGPLTNTAQNGTYFDLAVWTAISLSDTPCQKTGNANPRFPIYLKSYNTTAQKQAYDLFAQATTNASTPFAGALFMFEGYSQAGVKAPGDNATAFAYRTDNLLVAPLLTYTPVDAALDAYAHQIGTEMRDVLLAGSGEATLNTYVNYAYGDETPVAWYGSDEWRQTKLQTLKSEFDPEAQFSFYAPIA